MSSDSDPLQYIRDDVFAPFVKQIDLDNRKVSVHIPNPIIERLNNTSFTSDKMNERETSRGKLKLLSTQSITEDTDVSIEEQIKKKFESSEWKNLVEKTIKDGKTPAKKREENNNSLSTRRISRDDFFTVRLGDLDKNEGNRDIERLIIDHGCFYFDRCVVPRDEEGNFKQVCFVKFERLRDAVRFMDDCQGKIRHNNMVVSMTLIQG